MNKFLLTSAIAAMAVTATPALAAGDAAAALVTLSQLNLAVEQNLKFNGGGEIEGKIWIGGNALKTGGAATTQVGFGASNGQGTVTSAFNTVTVGGKSDIGFQIKNAVGGAYGAYIVGKANEEINIQDAAGTVKIGGNSVGGVKMTTGSTLHVAGNYTSQNGLSLSDNNSVWIGGNSTRIQGGNAGVNVKVGGNLHSIDLANGGSSAQIGGSLGAGGNSATKGSLTVLGNISNLSMNANNLTVKAGGAVSNISLSNASKLYAGGAVQVQNNNGGTVHANCGVTYANCTGVAAPTSPGVPTIAGLSSETTTMFDNFKALSTSLANLAVSGHAGTITPTNGTQAFTFGSGSSTGYTVFNVDQTIFGRNEFAYNFANTNTPIIINVRNTGQCKLTMTCSYNLDENFTGNASQFNRNVIWNFVDANNIILQKQFQGTLLAALADVQANVIEGSVVAKNFTMTNEIHLGTYKNANSNILLAGMIPEPGQWAMLISGFGIIGGVMRRRRSFADAA